jgi:hypothetical protein
VTVVMIEREPFRLSDDPDARLTTASRRWRVTARAFEWFRQRLLFEPTEVERRTRRRSG